MRVLVLGAEGMLGHKMVQTLSARFPEVCCSIRGNVHDPLLRQTGLFQSVHVIECLDAMNLPHLQSVLAAARPDVIVNCIGVIKQREEARAALPTITINALLPHSLAAWAAEWGGRVIHFSTDCVFSGRKGSYTESDPSDAEDLYGKSKFLGEVAAANAVTLRTSIIGRELSEFKSLLEWFLAQRGGTVHGYTRVVYAGVTTNYLATLVGDVIRDYPTLSGLYQVTSRPISKFDLLCMLRDAYGLDVTIVPNHEVVSDRSMIGTRFRQATGTTTPDWPDLVRELAGDPTPYESWRRG